MPLDGKLKAIGNHPWHPAAYAVGLWKWVVFHPLFLLSIVVCFCAIGAEVITVNEHIVDMLNQVAKERGLDMQILLEALCAALKEAYQRQFVGRERRKDQRRRFSPRIVVTLSDQPEKSELKVFVEKAVVEEVSNAALEISLESARKIKPDVKVGDCIAIELPLERFTRSAMQVARDVFIRRIQSEHLKRVYQVFRDRVGEIIKAEVRRIDKRGNVYLYADDAELFLPVREQIKTDNYRAGMRLSVYIKEVHPPEERRHGSRRVEFHPEMMIVVSRSDRELVRKLFEREIPDVKSGVVEVKAVARDPGVRSKVAVYSSDPNIDAVGACIGQRSKLVNAVVNELSGEQIDVVAWSDDPAEFLINALSPAKVDYVILNEDGRSATVIVQPDQLPTAIGKEGKNVSLAAKLTGWRIDIRSYEHLAQMLSKPSELVAEVESVESDESAEVVEVADESGSTSADG